MFLSSLLHSQRSLSTGSMLMRSKMRVKVSITISSALSLDVSSRCDDRNSRTPGKNSSDPSIHEWKVFLRFDLSDFSYIFAIFAKYEANLSKIKYIKCNYSTLYNFIFEDRRIGGCANRVLRNCLEITGDRSKSNKQSFFPNVFFFLSFY